MDVQLFTAVTDKGEILDFEEKQEGNRVFLTLKKELFANAKTLSVLRDLTKANAGDSGFYILPRNLHFHGEILTRFTHREDVVYEYDNTVTSVIGIKREGFSGIIRIDRNYKFSISVEVSGGAYTVSVRFDFTRNDRVYDDIRIEIVELPKDATYGDMARAERETRLSRGEIFPLSEKCKREAVEYARKYPLIRIRMGWKPVPSTIYHQTLETEPEMFVTCDFKRVRDIVDELKRQGVEGAELQLVGWNVGGHDGRWPQIFPADHRLGGDEELKKTVSYIKDNGFRVSLHTNLVDSYEIANNFQWKDICVKRDGQYHQEGNWGGGLSYRICLHKQVENNRRDLPSLVALNTNGLHYVDVISIIIPDNCHRPEHPCPTAKGMELARQIIREARDSMGGFSSEGGFDFAVGEIDYALYLVFGNGFGGRVPPILDAWLPFYELIYHGTLLYNPSSETVNYPIKGSKERLSVYLRGGKPTLYFFSKFRTGGAANWMGETDLITTTDGDLKASVKAVKDSLDEYTRGGFDERQLVYMSDYEIHENGIEAAIYEDGCAVVGNFSEKDAEWRGHVIPAGDYKVIKNV